SRLDLLTRIEERFGVYLSEATVDETTTVADLRRQVAGGATTATEFPLPRWATRPFWRGVRGLLDCVWGPLLRGYHRQECRGLEHLEGLRGPAIFIANHTSNLDTPAILAAMPAKWRRRVAVAAAADYWFAPDQGLTGRLAGPLAALLYNAFPFSRTDAVEASLRYLGELVDDGWSILLYPEGGRSDTGQMCPFKKGIGLIA